MSNRYLQQHAFAPEAITQAPTPGLFQVVVIPCHNEPDLLTSLRSLLACTLPKHPVEVIVVINAGQQDEEAIHQQNAKTYQAFLAFKAVNDSPQLTFHALVQEDLPPKHAGVGLARKIGMDEAVRRFEKVKDHDGVIVCFDADSLVEPNYLQAIEHFFQSKPKVEACSIHFEHPIEGEEKHELYEGIIKYELFLRYYIRGLKQIGYPYACHTIGSSMAVRSKLYQQQGGMNRRKAGEDFYFLHKLMPLGTFGELTETTVIPSPRVSDRVPFGTGKAMGDWLEKADGQFYTYDPVIFQELKALLDVLPLLYQDVVVEDQINQLPPTVQAFLQEQDFADALQEIRQNSASAGAFHQRCLRWLNGFRVLKYVHFSRDHYYPNVELEVAAAQLLNGQDIPVPTALELLKKYRKLDRQGV